MRIAVRSSIIVTLLWAGVMAVWASPLWREDPIRGAVRSGCVVASSSTWTALPTVSGDGDFLLYVTAVGTNTADLAGIIEEGNTATTAVGVVAIRLKPGITQAHPLSDNTTFFIRSLASGVAESACFEKVK